MSHELVEFQRECNAIQIPQGMTVTIPRGTQGIVTQALGGTYTLQIPAFGGLFRIADSDADAIGKEVARRDPTATATGGTVNEEMVWEQLRQVYDPEIPVNVVDLGLIYDLRLQDVPAGGYSVKVQMTLTAQGCGMGPAIAMDARRRIEAIPGVTEADVQVVWDPPWTPHMISAEGRSKLGMD